MALTTADLSAPGMTGKHCLKSPVKIVNLPPKGRSQFNRSCKVLSIAFATNLCNIVHSSITIKEDVAIRADRL